MRAGSASVAGEIAVRATSTLRTFTPGSRDDRRSSVRPSIPAETSSTTARAISEITKPPCRRRELPAKLRAPARSVCSSAARGNAQGRAPVRKEDRWRARRPAQTAARANRAGLPRRAANCRARTPRTGGCRRPPARCRARLRQAPAPRSRSGIGAPAGRGPRRAPTRMASSRSRETARASSRLAIFTQAISSTRLTAPSSSHSVERTSPTSGRSGSAKKASRVEVQGIRGKHSQRPQAGEAGGTACPTTTSANRWQAGKCTKIQGDSVARSFSRIPFRYWRSGYFSDSTLFAASACGIGGEYQPGPSAKLRRPGAAGCGTPRFGPETPGSRRRIGDAPESLRLPRSPELPLLRHRLPVRRLPSTAPRSIS